ncbi:MAG: hypothetical protein ACK56I_29075, partial [bacterium]
MPPRALPEDAGCLVGEEGLELRWGQATVALLVMQPEEAGEERKRLGRELAVLVRRQIGQRRKALAQYPQVGPVVEGAQHLPRRFRASSLDKE